MNAIMPFDELNVLRESLPAHFEDGKIRSREDLEDIVDELLDIFLLAYARGASYTNAYLSSGIEPTMDDIKRVIDRKVVGKTWRERLEDYYESGSQKPRRTGTPTRRHTKPRWRRGQRPRHGIA